MSGAERIVRVTLMKKGGGASWGEASTEEEAREIALKHWRDTRGSQKPDAERVRVVQGDDQ